MSGMTRKAIPAQGRGDKKVDPGETFKANAATKNLFFGIAEPQVLH